MATIPADLTWEDVRRGIALLCEDRGWHHGVPLPSTTDSGRRVVLAKGTPMAEAYGHDRPVSFDTRPSLRVCHDIDETQQGVTVHNGWTRSAQHILVGRENGKIAHARISVSEERFQMMLHTLMCRAGLYDVETEITAMHALCKRLSRPQTEMYLICGMFTETSPKSGVTYVLRKGLPTVALKCDRVPGGERRRFLAALCTHPLAWYEGTHVGAYPPSDEVLANLLQIRADEHGFWKKANQHGIDDPMSAI